MPRGGGGDGSCPCFVACALFQALAYVYHAGKWLLSTFENVSVFLKAPQVRLEQAKCSFGIPRIHPSSSQADYAAFLLLYDAPPFGDKLLGAAKIVFGIHLSNNAHATKQAQDLFPPPPPRGMCDAHCRWWERP